MKNLKAVFPVLAALLIVTDSLACTTAIVSAGASATGRPLLWKQRDTGNPYNTVVFVSSTDSTYAYTGLFGTNDLRHRSVYAGENEKGFAIVNNNSYNLAVGEYSTANGSFMRRALERCTTVEEFEAMLKAENPRRTEANFGVIDAFGGAAYFEAADSSVSRFDVPDGGYLVRSNFSLSGTADGVGFSTAGTGRYARTGYARYLTALALMSSHKGKFTPSFMIDSLGRSFYNAILGYDASEESDNSIVYDEDFIPRPTTTASVCFDGSACMWAAVGYTPAAYAMPLCICSELPSCLAAANALAERLERRMHPFGRDAGVKYIDFGIAGRIMDTVRRYEKEASAMVGDNPALDRLFARFEKEFD